MNPQYDERIRGVYTSEFGFVGSPLSKIIIVFLCVGHALGLIWNFDYLTTLKTLVVTGVLASGVAFLSTSQVQRNSRRLKSLFIVFVMMVMLFQVVQNV